MHLVAAIWFEVRSVEHVSAEQEVAVHDCPQVRCCVVVAELSTAGLDLEHDCLKGLAVDLV